MKETLITLLETFGYPVRLQGSFREDEPYPASFFTFWNGETVDGPHYDNDTISYIWSFDVNFYSNDPALVNSVLRSARDLLKQNGFIVSGVGFDIPSDEPTHTGRGMGAIIIERKQNDGN